MLIIPKSIDVKDTLKDAGLSLNQSGDGIVVITKNKKFFGIVTDGDLRRGLLNGLPLESRVDKITNKKCITSVLGIEKQEAKKVLLENQIKHLPLINADGVCETIFVEDDLNESKEFNGISVLLMAGGFGKRLMPLTKDVPKPMLPIDGVPLMEKIIKDLKKSGLEKIFISVFYKKEVIKNYFEDGERFGVDIEYIEENEPLGTAGCLYYLKEKKFNNLLVLNADIYTDVNYKILIEDHLTSNAKATMCAVIHQYKFPFGVINKLSSGGISIHEKPTISKIANAGVYMINKKVFSKMKYGPKDMTDLICSVVPVNIFTLFENWTDIGVLSSYQSVQSQKD